MRSLVAALTAVVTVPAAGCSVVVGDDAGTVTSGRLRSDAASDFIDELDAYVEAFRAGNVPGAFAFLSERCQDLVGEPGFAEVVAEARKRGGSARTMQSYEAHVEAEQATVTYTYGLDEADQVEEQWILEANEWRNDEC